MRPLRVARSRRFVESYRLLTKPQRELFSIAEFLLLQDLQAEQPYDEALQVGSLPHPFLWKLQWGVDGFATFNLKPGNTDDELLVVWRRIGNHRILR